MLKRTFYTASKVCKAADANAASASGSGFNNILDVFNTANSLNTNAQAQKITIDNRFIPEFNNKTTYDPFDFSIASQRYQSKVYKTKLAKQLKTSSFNSAEINPVNFYLLPHLLSSYVNQSGQIMHRSVTGLSNKKQKQISKAIRRARAFGLMSSVAKDVSTFPKRGSTL